METVTVVTWSQKMLAPWKNSYDKPRQCDITLPKKKIRDITLPTKVHIVKAMVFSVVMYICESWTIKKAECQRTDAFELWCGRRFLRVPWTARRANQSILKKINWIFIGRTDVEAEAPILLATWCEESTHWKRPWCWERLRAGEEGDNRGWDGWMASPIDGHGFVWTPGIGDRQGVLLFMAWLSDWTELNWIYLLSKLLRIKH